LDKLNKISDDTSTITVEVPAVYINPEVSLSEINNLGIKELLGVGVSKFKGSISSRIYNIKLASSRINSYLVAPGEIFSFNKALGDVSGLSGYKPAYVIKEGKTVLDDGGGICQVSTTLFRAVLNAGLPVVERTPHSYRVGYYEQGSDPGIDATVFSPSVDFKFRNDTPGHLLIQMLVDLSNYSLTTEIYGSDDGRISQVTKPIVQNVIAPGEDIYIEDSSLKKGVVRQIEYKAWGAKISFNYNVKNNGNIIYSKQFVSNYKPHQSVYLVGTQ